ncbi:sugar ABC transporter permease (plasmid) [Burkholderia humptydooensis]|uniref:Sugar ABC transporter permease n=1 Tax=Burkholderia humptydooensis TaxID=430531 RepID=A0A7U4P837_9BURK|nr:MULTISPECIES: sugar ABC transporter permease [Burkholderia]ALX44724.1 ABC transporter permease [Burkholderia humptydooensis]QPS42076.1 sugar ABC transporter permease [Burkholderia humptydooensis]
MRIHAALPYLLSLPALLACIGILIPFFTAVGYSFQRYNLSFPDARAYIWFDNYWSLFTDSEFWNTVRVSLVYTVATVGVQLLLGLGIALLLQKRNAVNNAISVLLILPLMVAPAIASLMWKLMTNPGFGVLNWLLGLVGITDFGWASRPGSAMFTVVLVDTWVYTPFITVLLLAGLRALPRQPFEAAELDGVPATFVFFRITLPMLLPYILTAGMFRMLDSIQQFDIIYSMTQGGPGNVLTVFQIQAYLDAFSFSNIGKSAALVLVLWAITYALSTVFIKHWLKLRQRARGQL